jgi:hypothetical protein
VFCGSMIRVRIAQLKPEALPHLAKQHVPLHVCLECPFYDWPFGAVEPAKEHPELLRLHRALKSANDPLYSRNRVSHGPGVKFSGSAKAISA